MKILEILSSPYTYATIVSIGAFIAAFGAQKVITQGRETNARIPREFREFREFENSENSREFRREFREFREFRGHNT
jgi:hypothetical protein